MLNQIVNAIEPVVVSAAVAVITAIIGVVGNVAIKFISTKKSALVAKIGADKYNAELQLAREVWGITDEDFRIHPELTKTVETAAAKFADEIRKKLSDLSDAEVEHLRQAVAGEVNKGKEAVEAPATQDVPQQTITVNVTAPATVTPADIAQKAAEAVKQAAFNVQ